ncbi:unnamed protein product [Cunninghamella blakesleeana]
MDSFNLYEWTPPTADIDAVRNKINGLLKQFEEHIEEEKKTHLSKVQQYEEKIKDLKASNEALEKTIKERENIYGYIKKDLPNFINRKENLVSEINATRQKNQLLLNQLDQAKRTQTSLKEQLTQKTIDFTKEQRQLHEERQRNRQYLSELIKYSGLKVIPLKLNNLKFEFTLIDEKNPDKVFSISLNMDNNEYTVLECQPMIPLLENLMSDLRQHGDPFLFIKLVRQQFCKLASTVS